MESWYSFLGIMVLFSRNHGTLFLESCTMIPIQLLRLTRPTPTPDTAGTGYEEISARMGTFFRASA